MVSYGLGEDGAFSLNAAISGVVKHAKVKGAQMLLRSAVAYDVLARSQNTAASFGQATKFVVQAMTESMAKKLEVELFYGQDNIGVIDSVGSNDVVITEQEWASGVFIGGRGMRIDILSAAGSLKQTVTIASVDFSTRTIATVETVAGTVAAGDVIKPAGAHGKQMAGLVKILSNEGSLFEIDAAQYETWKGNVVPNVGQLDMKKLTKEIVKACEKGLDKDVVAIVSPKAWDVLMQDLAALRKIDQSYSSKKLENGTQAIEFYSLNGKIEVRASTYCKDGYAMIFAPEDFARIGATDVTFSLPGMPDQFLLQAPNNAGFEMRVYSNQSLFTKSIGRTVLLKGITFA